MKSIFLFLVCMIGGLAVWSQPLSPKSHAAIVQAMKTQEDAWNRGDIPAFMEYYWRSDSLSFVGSSGLVEGWQGTLDRYNRTYPDTEAMGRLKFSIIKLRALGKKAAYLIGTWNLTRTSGDIGGYFTLIWKKVKGKWVIVSDHTS